MKGQPSTLSIDVLGSLALLGMIAISFFVTVRPTIDRLREVETLRSSLVDATHRARTLELDVAAAQRDLSSAAKALESVSVRLVSVDARNSRLAELTALASSLGMTVDELSPQEPEKGELFDRVMIDMRGRGSYADAARFLHLIHDEFLDTEVQSFRIARNDGNAMYDIRLVWHATPSERSRVDIPGK